MTQLLQFETESGETIWVETEDNIPNAYSSEEMSPVSARGASKGLQGKFEEAMGTLKTVANAVVKQVKEIAQNPEQVEIKVGLKFNVEAGVVIAKTSSEGNLEVTLRWHQEEKKPLA